jgi:hypothetical protein
VQSLAENVMKNNYQIRMEQKIKQMNSGDIRELMDEQADPTKMSPL